MADWEQGRYLALRRLKKWRGKKRDATQKKRRQKIKKTLISAGLFFTGATVLMVAVFGLMSVTTSSIMLQTHLADYRQGKVFTAIDQKWVSRDAISPYLFNAVIAAEDQHFYEHDGLDFKAISTAISDYRAGSDLRGASTISQQVAKNLFLSPSRSLFRKGLEAWFTLWIELLWSKERILEVYVNIAEWGDHLFGVEAASQHYFGVSANQLNIAQCALLAAVLPNPKIYQVGDPRGHVRKRQRWILKQMRNLGYY